MNKDAENAGSFLVRSSGNIGQEILDDDGRIICWTTDEWVAQVVVKLLNQNEGLLETGMKTRKMFHGAERPVHKGIE